MGFLVYTLSISRYFCTVVKTQREFTKSVQLLHIKTHFKTQFPSSIYIQSSPVHTETTPVYTQSHNTHALLTKNIFTQNQDFVAWWSQFLDPWIRPFVWNAYEIQASHHRWKSYCSTKRVGKREINTSKEAFKEGFIKSSSNSCNFLSIVTLYMLHYSLINSACQFKFRNIFSYWFCPRLYKLHCRFIHLPTKTWRTTTRSKKLPCLSNASVVASQRSAPKSTLSAYESDTWTDGFAGCVPRLLRTKSPVPMKRLGRKRLLISTWAFATSLRAWVHPRTRLRSLSPRWNSCFWGGWILPGPLRWRRRRRWLVWLGLRVCFSQLLLDEWWIIVSAAAFRPLF